MKTDTAVLRRFADAYQARTQKDIRTMGLPRQGDHHSGPWTLIRDACDELDELRLVAQSTERRVVPVVIRNADGSLHSVEGFVIGPLE